MACRIVLVVLVLALAGCGADARTAPPRPEVVSVLQDDALLLHRGEAGTARTLDAIAALGVDWVRVTAGWSVIAGPRPPADPRDPASYPPGAWESLDRVARMAADRGLGLNLDVGFWAPAWAVARPEGGDRERWTPDPAAFADFAEAVARRYPRAAAFTVWNEPNHPVFLLPQFGPDGSPASPGVYRRMLQAAVPRIRTAAPDALVLVGATSSLGARTDRPERDRMAPMTFLRALACVDDRLDPVRTGDCAGFRALPGDGWSHHPYPVDLAPWAASPDLDDIRTGDLPRLRELLAELHRRGRFEERLDVWVTEFGYQTNPPDPTQPHSLARQAAWLAEAELLARQAGVRSTAQFLLQDLPERPGPNARMRWRDYQSGLLDPAGRPKPALATYARPLVARVRRDELELWALVRAVRDGTPVRVRIVDGSGAPLHEGRTDAEGVVDATVPRREASRVRLDVLGPSGWAPGPWVVPTIR